MRKWLALSFALLVSVLGAGTARAINDVTIEVLPQSQAGPCPATVKVKLAVEGTEDEWFDLQLLNESNGLLLHSQENLRQTDDGFADTYVTMSFEKDIKVYTPGTHYIQAKVSWSLIGQQQTMYSNRWRYDVVCTPPANPAPPSSN